MYHLTASENNPKEKVMAKKTIYVPDADMDVFEQAKRYAGNSISSVIVKALKDYVVAREKEDHGYETFNLFDGIEYQVEGTREGENVQFVGKLLSSKPVADEENAQHTTYSLYLTRKGKLLLHTVVCNDYPSAKYSYEVKDRILDFKDHKLPSELLSEAEKRMPGITCKVLDI